MPSRLSGNMDPSKGLGWLYGVYSDVIPGEAVAMILYHRRKKVVKR
jgi:hypothetical protein